MQRKDATTYLFQHARSLPHVTPSRDSLRTNFPKPADGSVAGIAGTDVQGNGAPIRPSIVIGADGAMSAASPRRRRKNFIRKTTITGFARLPSDFRDLVGGLADEMEIQTPRRADARIYVDLSRGQEGEAKRRQE